MNAAVIFVIGTVQLIVVTVRLFGFIEHHPRAVYGPHYLYVFLYLGFPGLELALGVVSALAGGLWNISVHTADNV
jgi:hypothetical protein